MSLMFCMCVLRGEYRTLSYTDMRFGDVFNVLMMIIRIKTSLIVP